MRKNLRPLPFSGIAADAHESKVSASSNFCSVSI